jgi:hypothetical protein
MVVKLVAIGDSLTQGFQSGSICRTDLSYSAMLAKTLKINDFSFPDFQGKGGLPFNIEHALRLLDGQDPLSLKDVLRFTFEDLTKLPDSGDESVNPFEVAKKLGAFIPQAKNILNVLTYMDEVEDYWENGDGGKESLTGPLHHNIGVWGFEVLDCLQLTHKVAATLVKEAGNKDDPFSTPSVAMYRTAKRTFNPKLEDSRDEHSQMVIAQLLKEADPDNKIDNLIFWLGANNCLGCVTGPKVVKTPLAENGVPGFDLNVIRPQREVEYTLWQPIHFKESYERALAELERLDANHVFVGTIPYVSIPPITRGSSPITALLHGPKENEQDDKGHFEFYTHFYVWDEDFQADIANILESMGKEPASRSLKDINDFLIEHEKLLKSQSKFVFLTRREIAEIDTFIDKYNASIRELVKLRQAQDKSWHVAEVGNLLNQLAYRRHQGLQSSPEDPDPVKSPISLDVYPVGLQQALLKNKLTRDRVVIDQNGNVVKVLLDTRYLQINLSEFSLDKRYQGGLFSLDGVHPTTIGYGLVADVFLKKMKKAHEKVGRANTQKWELDWDWIVASDTLVTSPPGILYHLKDAFEFARKVGLAELMRKSVHRQS